MNFMLAKCLADNDRDWPEHLSNIAFFYNASTHKSTKYTPFFLMHGYEPRWEMDLQLEVEPRGPYSVNDYADLLINRLEGAHEIVREHLSIAASWMQDWYNRKVNVQHFDAGDEVYVLNLRMYQGKCPKWICKYSYTGLIVKKIDNVTYVVHCDRTPK